MMYIKFFHGRPDVNQDMEDWGFEGPILGPLQWVHTTYATDIKLAAVGAQEAVLDVEIVEGCAEINGGYYGDWSVFYSENPPPGSTTLLDHINDGRTDFEKGYTKGWVDGFNSGKTCKDL